MDCGPSKKEAIPRLLDRGRKTRSKARALYATGLPWGKAIISCIETLSQSVWEITGVGTQNKVSLVCRVDEEGRDDPPDLPRRSRGRGSNGQSGEAKRARTDAKPGKRLQAKLDKPCPGHNSKEGCTKQQAACPHGK